MNSKKNFDSAQIKEENRKPKLLFVPSSSGNTEKEPESSDSSVERKVKPPLANLKIDSNLKYPRV